MNVTVMAALELRRCHWERWSQIQQSNPSLASPFFSFHYVRAVAAERPAVRVGVIEEAGRIIGFFPFEAGWWGAGRAVAEPISDYQGPVLEPDAACAAAELVRSCGLSSWRFTHLPASLHGFRPHHDAVSPSPIIDLRLGYAAYRKQRRNGRLEGLERKLEREVGPLRLVVHVPEAKALAQLIELKSKQYARQGQHGGLCLPWVQQLLYRLCDIQEADFAGLLTALYAGDHLVAAHFGLRSRTVWHYWYPAYDPAWGRYSPGLIMLARMAEAAEGLGIRTIDLGKGDGVHKQRFANGVIEVAEGQVGRSWAASLAQWARAGKHRIKRSMLGRPMEPLYRWMISRGARGAPTAAGPDRAGDFNIRGIQATPPAGAAASMERNLLDARRQ